MKSYYELIQDKFSELSNTRTSTGQRLYNHVGTLTITTGDEQYVGIYSRAGEILVIQSDGVTETILKTLTGRNLGALMHVENTSSMTNMSGDLATYVAPSAVSVIGTETRAVANALPHTYKRTPYGSVTAFGGLAKVTDFHDTIQTVSTILTGTARSTIYRQVSGTLLDAGVGFTTPSATFPAGSYTNAYIHTNIFMRVDNGGATSRFLTGEYHLGASKIYEFNNVDGRQSSVLQLQIPLGDITLDGTEEMYFSCTNQTTGIDRPYTMDFMLVSDVPVATPVFESVVWSTVGVPIVGIDSATSIICHYSVLSMYPNDEARQSTRLIGDYERLDAITEVLQSDR